MEDLWYVQDSGVDMNDFADIAEYRQFLKRFCCEEEKENQRRLLFKEETTRTEDGA